MPFAGFDLSSRVALVTGVTSGLGRAIAVGLAQAGAAVIVGSRDDSKVADTVAELSRFGAGHSGLRLDVADPASVDAAFKTIAEQRERLDILVNAAGTI